MLLYVFFTSAIFLLLAKLFDNSPDPIFGIYQRPDGKYWLKVIFMYFMLTVKKIVQTLIPKKRKYFEGLDTVQKLASSSLAADAVYFNGANKTGHFLTFGIARRNNRLVDGFLYLKIHSLQYGLLESLKLPDTTLFNAGEENSYEAEGIKVHPLEPLKKWRMIFDGQLKEAKDNSNLHNVTIDAVFTSDKPFFNYDTDMDCWSMAKALAYEKWSRSYFKNIQKSHQLHYEQFGALKAKIVIDEKEFTIEVDAVRDHSIAVNRNWGSMRRYVIHWISTENGDHFSVGSICQPISYSRMQIGYMYNAHDKKMYAITSSSLQLYQYGELGVPPRDYAFTFTAGKTDYEVQVNLIETPYFYISKQWECKVYEF